MRSIHPLPTVLVSLLALGLLATPAWARSGRYRGPGGAVPPGLREPADPTPPPPPPPGPSAIRPMPAGRPPVPPREPVPREVPTYADWVFTWHHHGEALAPVAPAPPLEPSRRAAALAALRAAVDDASLPAYARGGAIVALGRATESAEDADRLRRLLHDGRRDAWLGESAAIALGLLRRSREPRPLDAAGYDRVREALLAVLESDGHQRRTRGFAALALGLLGDQPTRDAATARATTARLLALLGRRESTWTVPAAVHKALALQPPSSITGADREALRRAALTGRRGEDALATMERAQAIWALATLGAAEDGEALLDLMTSPAEKDPNVGRSAALALGPLIARQPVAARVVLVGGLLDAAARVEDLTTRAFALTALVPALASGSPEERREVLDGTLAGETLLVTLAGPNGVLAGHAALVLGRLLAAPHGGAASGATTVLGTKAAALLRERLGPGEPLDVRTACALAMGIAGLPDAPETLGEILAEDPLRRALHGYALLGLAHHAARPGGAAAEDPHLPLDEALTEETALVPRVLAAQAAGVARAPGTVAVLGRALDARLVQVAGEAAIALARIGTPAAADALLAVAGDAEASGVSRGAALAGLGRLLDPEVVPSPVRLTRWTNHRAAGDLFGELFALL